MSRSIYYNSVNSALKIFVYSSRLTHGVIVAVAGLIEWSQLKHAALCLTSTINVQKFVLVEVLKGIIHSIRPIP